MAAGRPDSYGERVQLELGALGLLGRRRSSGCACCRVRMRQAVERQQALGEHRQESVFFRVVELEHHCWLEVRVGVGLGKLNEGTSTSAF